MTKACGDCIYYGADSACRRHSPMTTGQSIVWPVVDPITDWCAEGYNEADGFYDQAPVLPAFQYARTMKAAP